MRWVSFGFSPNGREANLDNVNLRGGGGGGGAYQHQKFVIQFALYLSHFTYFIIVSYWARIQQYDWTV